MAEIFSLRDSYYYREVTLMIYLDNAATTSVLPRAADAASYAMRKCYANPSALYHFGIEAEKLVLESKGIIAEAIGCRDEEIIFTSGATESNNTAIFGTAEIYGKRKNKVVLTAVEHPSVTEAFEKLRSKGFDVTAVYPDSNGIITADALVSAVDDDTFFISAMLVNNETGAILPVKEAFSRIKKLYPGCVAHCDCAQGFMKIPVSAKTLGADMVSLSGHKVHAPKGIGALYVKKGVRFAPMFAGGGQQGGLRSGTENVPGIYAFAKAVEELSRTLDSRFTYISEIKKYAVGKLTEAGMGINSPADASPYIISVHVPSIKSETVLHFLEARGICVSSGSACSRGKKSAVLRAFGFKDDVTDSTVRVSTSSETKKEDIDALVNGLKCASDTLIKTAPHN